MSVYDEVRQWKRQKVAQYESQRDQARRRGDSAAVARYERMIAALGDRPAPTPRRSAPVQTEPKRVGRARRLTPEQAAVAIAKTLVERGVPAPMALNHGKLATSKAFKRKGKIR